MCTDCGGPAAQWSQVHGTDGTDPIAHYQPRCRKCHSKYDGRVPLVRSRRTDLAVDTRSSSEPSYLQLAAQLRERIRDGRIGPREALPSISQLTGETGLAVNTVRHAVSVLMEEGWAYTVPGRGTFAAEKPPEA